MKFFFIINQCCAVNKLKILCIKSNLKLKDFEASQLQRQVKTTL